MAADFPIGFCVDGDYETRLIMVEPDATMDEIVSLAAPYVVGRFTPDRPGKILRVRHQDKPEPFARDARVKDVLVPWDPVEFIWE